MSRVDAAWLHADHPTNPMMVTGLLRFAGRLDPERVAEVLRTRMLDPYPVFRRRLARPLRLLGRPVWEDDPDFDLRAHLVTEELPASDGPAGLQHVVSRLMSTPLAVGRPLWQFHLLRSADGGSALVARLHHCIADGVALAQVLVSLADGAVEEQPRRRQGPPRGGGAAARLSRAGALVRGVGRVAGLPFTGAAPLPVKLGVEKVAAWAAPASLDEMKALARAARVTVNDTALAVLTGALRRYLRDNGEAPRDLRACVPVDLRGGQLEPGDVLGNRFGLVFLELPVGLTTPLARLRELKRRSDAAKSSTEALVTHALMAVLGSLPPRVLRVFTRLLTRRTSLIVSNMPGPRQPLRLAGVTLREVLFWVPQSAAVGLGVSIFSYNGGVHLGVAADAGLLARPEALLDAFADELQALRAAVLGPPVAVAAP